METCIYYVLILIYQKCLTTFCITNCVRGSYFVIYMYFRFRFYFLYRMPSNSVNVGDKLQQYITLVWLCFYVGVFSYTLILIIVLGNLFIMAFHDRFLFVVCFQSLVLLTFWNMLFYPFFGVFRIFKFYQIYHIVQFDVRHALNQIFQSWTSVLIGTFIETSPYLSNVILRTKYIGQVNFYTSDLFPYLTWFFFYIYFAEEFFVLNQLPNYTNLLCCKFVMINITRRTMICWILMV